MTPTQASTLRQLIIKFATETILSEHTKRRANAHLEPGEVSAVELAGAAVNEFITACTVDKPTTAWSLRRIDTFNVTEVIPLESGQVLVKLASDVAADQFIKELETP